MRASLRYLMLLRALLLWTAQEQGLAVGMWLMCCVRRELGEETLARRRKRASLNLAFLALLLLCLLRALPEH